MFCWQCQETAGGKGCTRRGVCGKDPETADLQDLLIFVLQGVALAAADTDDAATRRRAGRFVCENLFATVTNVNFDAADIRRRVKAALELRDQLKLQGAGNAPHTGAPDCVGWEPHSEEEYAGKAASVGEKAIDDEDARSVISLILYGLKGAAAYIHHAAVLDREDDGIYREVLELLGATARERELTALLEWLDRCAALCVRSMEILDAANTATYGHPEAGWVTTAVQKRPGILVSGHDLRDLYELLRQSEGSGIDIYTHGEMLPAHFYPELKKFPHLVGHYGGAWWRQPEEFAAFRGPILMTTNCLTPVREAYRERLFTTNMVAWPGVQHISGEHGAGGDKDFSALIELARRCDPPEDRGAFRLPGGYAHRQLERLAPRLVKAVQQGKIRRFVVMGGCDGRHQSREYYTRLAQALPPDSVILTAGCAKYRYNRLRLGEVAGIPRVLDAGQCNDSYSLAVAARLLAEAFGVSDINELPVRFDIAWYEQKAITVLLALLKLGFRGLRIGPTLPAFLSPRVEELLVRRYQLKGIGTVEEDLADILGG